MRPDPDAAPPAPPRLPFRQRARSLLSGDWLPRILVESTLVVFSILAALAVNEWAQDRADRELATQALAAFEREIRQNRARLEDVGPYRSGLRQVILRFAESGEIETSSEFQTVIGLEPLRPAFLTNTVWETALTTGAIPHISFDLVNALSLTYSLQERLEEFSRSGMPTLARGGFVAAPAMPGAVSEVTVYLAELSRSEAELLAAYDEVLRILGEALQTDPAPGPGGGSGSGPVEPAGADAAAGRD